VEGDVRHELGVDEVTVLLGNSAQREEVAGSHEGGGAEEIENEGTVLSGLEVVSKGRWWVDIPTAEVEASLTAGMGGVVARVRLRLRRGGMLRGLWIVET
jgi:hypothetical protein